jgi:hypothetical protein
VAKLKGGLDVRQDRARLALVRDVLADANPGSRPGLMLDANEAWTPKQAVRHVAELERTGDGGNMSTSIRSTRPAASSARFSEMLPCDRIGTSVVRFRRSIAVTASSLRTVEFCHPSGSSSVLEKTNFGSSFRLS